MFMTTTLHLPINLHGTALTHISHPTMPGAIPTIPGFLASADSVRTMVSGIARGNWVLQHKPTQLVMSNNNNVGLMVLLMELDQANLLLLMRLDSDVGTVMCNTCSNGTQSTRHFSPCQRTASKL